MEPDTLARMLLFALQVFTIIMVLVFSGSPWSWLNWLPNGVGIGECSDDHGCWTAQMVYRTEAAACLVFLLLVILSVSGCAPRAWYHSCPSFISVILLSLVFIFFPNSIFDLFANFAVVVSSAFLVLQTLLLVDFAQECNDTVFSSGISARRITFNSDYLQAAKIVLIVLSVLMLLGSLAVAIYLWMAFTSGWVVAVALVISLILLGVSITDWCEHGSLFASSLATLYSMWLAYEVLIIQEADYTRPDFAKWMGLIVVTLTLAASVFGSGLGLGGEEPMLGQGSGDGLSSTAFAVQAGIHALAALYVATSLAPAQSSVGFASRVVALFGSLLLYGWTLVAPKVLPGRF